MFNPYNIYNGNINPLYQTNNSNNTQPNKLYRDDKGNIYEDRGGALIPFLAGVLVTTPFIFLNKNDKQPMYYPQQPPQYYPMYQQPQFAYPYSNPYFR